MPGVALIPRLSVRNAALLLELGPARGSRAPGILGEIVAVDLEEVRLDIHRPDRDPQVLTISAASGDLQSGGFELDASGGGAEITLSGEAGGLSLSQFEGEISVQGDNFANLADLLGFAAPDTPRYALSGSLSRSGETWRFAPFMGDVGDSDLEGSLSIDFAGERPFVDADLHSQSLDFDDLGVIVGAPSDVEDGTPNSRQEEISERYAQDRRLIPETEIDIARISAVDADVRFEADSVRAGLMPLESLSAHMTLEDSMLRFDPFIVTTPQGRLETTGEIDARDPDNVVGSLSGGLDGFALDQLGARPLLRGALQAEFDVAFQGGRTRAAFASLDGDAAAWSADAEIRALAEEAAGLDVGEVLALMVSESDADPEFRPARCLVVRATIEEGLARLDPAVLDTADSLTRLEGTVDLGTEGVDIEVVSDAKDLSWGALFGGIELAGTLRDPDIVAPIGEITLQGAAAALLGGLTAGLAALPFVETGQGENAPCGALLASARAFSPPSDRSSGTSPDTAEAPPSSAPAPAP